MSALPAVLMSLLFLALGFLEQADRFIQAINEGRFLDLRDYPGFATNAILTKVTNLEAEEMTEQTVDALIVIDENHRLKGVVEREQILSKLTLAFARQ